MGVRTSDPDQGGPKIMYYNSLYGVGGSNERRFRVPGSPTGVEGILAPPNFKENPQFWPLSSNVLYIYVTSCPETPESMPTERLCLPGNHGLQMHSIPLYRRPFLELFLLPWLDVLRSSLTRTGQNAWPFLNIGCLARKFVRR